MEVLRLGVELELWQLAYATETRQPSHGCDLHHSSWQCQILNPLREARDRTGNLMAPSQIRFHCAKMGTPIHFQFNPQERTVARQPTCAILVFNLSTWYPQTCCGTRILSVLHAHLWTLERPLVVVICVP